MKVRVIAGKLCYKATAGAAAVYSPADGIIEIDDAAALTLIGRGAVVSCEDAPVAADEIVTDSNEEQSDADIDLSTMTRADLLKYADDCGIDIPATARTKAAIIEAIEKLSSDSDFDGTAVVE